MVSQLRWKNLTLAKKMTAGFTVMALFTFAALAISFIGLYSLNSTAKNITRHDMLLIRSANRLSEALKKQEVILDTRGAAENPQLLADFHRHETAFRYILEQVRRELPAKDLAALQSSYGTYQELAHRFLTGDAAIRKELRDVSDQLSEVLGKLEAAQQSLVETRVSEAERQENRTVGLTLVLATAGFILAVAVGMVTTFKISRAMARLKTATTRIAEGDFEYDPQVPAGDEIGELAQSFQAMALRLKELELVSLDASPLTRLPGNIAIEQALNGRLQQGGAFAFCYADLDHFKAFNDAYGYLKGSEVIRLSGEIIRQCVGRQAGEAGFVGHIGGDDFVFLVDAGQAEAICREILERFDAMIATHYDKAHLAAGFLRGVDRYGEKRSFPIMTISIAVLLCGEGRGETALDIAQRAARIKDEVKGLAGSNYLVDPGGSVLLAAADEKGLPGLTAAPNH